MTGKAIVKIKRIGACGTDLHAYGGSQPSFTYPRVLGHELAGELVAVGQSAAFSLGEAVTVMPYLHCERCIACRAGKTNCCEKMQVCGVHIDGGMTEYFSVPTYSLRHGNDLSFDELALVEPLAIGAHSIRRAAIQPGEFVLVIGARPIGLGVMEFARLARANVIALDINANWLAFCRQQLGIPHSIDARESTVPEQLRDITNGGMPTVVIDATSNLNAIEQGFAYLAHGGRYILVGLQKQAIHFSHPDFHKREATLMSSRNATSADFDHVINSIRKGPIKPATYITHRVHFDQARTAFDSWLDPATEVIKALITLP